MHFWNRNVDMLHAPLAKNLLLFTLPIALASIVQQLFHSADTAVVGYFDHADALAAVGTNTEIVALIVTISSGLSLGGNVIFANRIGKNQTRELPQMMQTIGLLAVAIGVCGMLIGQGIAGALLRLLHTPAEIFPVAQRYLRIYLLGYPFLLMYDFGAAVLRARGDSTYPFVALVLSGVANVLLNLLFVVGFRLGVAGVAIATDLATALSAALVLIRLRKTGMLPLGKWHFQWKIGWEVLKTGVPSAVQGAVFCFANLFVQASINSFGSIAIAGSTIAMNFEYFAYYGITAFGQTATTFVGQNHAAGQLRRCRNILWISLGFSVLCSLVLIVPIVLFRDFFAGFFSTEAAVIQSAGERILCILLFEPMCSLYEIPAGVLRGSGHPVLPMASTMLGTCAFRIVWIFTAFGAEPSPAMLYHAFPLSWCATILLVALSFLCARPFRDATSPCQKGNG